MNRYVSIYDSAEGKESHPDDLLGFIAWIKAKLEQVPKPHWADANIDFSTINEYDMIYSRIQIGYERPETQEEIDQRKKIAAERQPS